MPSPRGKRLLSITRFGLVAVVLALSGTSAPAGHEDKHGDQKDSVFSAETNLVSLDVTVADRSGRPVDRLKKEDFRVLEAGVRQNIAFFSHENRPVSWGLVLDRSGSMAEMMDEVYNAALHSVEVGTPDDDSFIIAFDTSVNIIQDFTSDRRKLLDASKRITAGGRTALYDAVAQAVDHIRHGRHQKKVMVVVTDGDDNSSRLAFPQLLDTVKESEVLIYTVGLFESMDRSAEGRTKKELKQLAEMTGGFAYFPRNMKQCDRACRDIAEQVSHQYSLGYYPADTNWDGKWRDLRVELVRRERLAVKTRRGYFARGESALVSHDKSEEPR